MTYIILTILGLLLTYYFYRGYINTKSIAINTITIDQDKSTTNHSSLRILQISDMHIENISVTPEQLYQKLKDQPIDIIALTGDFLDRKRSIPKLEAYLEVFKKLNPIYGSYAIFGNHDYVLKDENFKRLKELLEAYDIKTMQNDSASIKVDGKNVNIIGIDDFSTKHSNIDEAYKGLEDGYNLVLTHDPNIVLHMPDNHFDYLLSGHFHGGQIYWPKPYHLAKMGKLARMNIIKGLHYHNGRAFYISEGLGQTGVNVRVGSRPEITFHEVHIQAKEKQNRLNETIAG